MSGRGDILVVDDEPNILKTLAIGLQAIGFRVDSFRNPVDAVDGVGTKTYDIAFIDLMMEPLDGMQVLKEITARSPATTCVMITAHGTIDSAVEAIKSGAFDFLQKPFDLEELQLFTNRVFEHHELQAEVQRLRRRIALAEPCPEIITRNAAMRRQLELARQVAESQLTVLIEGESGTGKELVAQMIHRLGTRAGKPFVRVECSALPETLLESELFGHSKGAFTGAVREREGRFESAAGGTVFLDEIGEIPPAVQVKLLRFLQDREFERVGENVTRRVDVRVIAATNRNLAEAIRQGAFREDLYYRLNAVRISLPPLRDRPEDVLPLVYHVLKKTAGEAQPPDISPEALRLLTAYPWPGNVRELENTMERAALLAQGGAVQPSHLPPELHAEGDDGASRLSLEQVERRHIAHILRIARDLDEAARILEIDPATLWRKRKKYGL